MSTGQTYGAGTAAKKSKKVRMSGYQAYYEGYTQVKVPKKRGSGFKIVRIYTDPYFVQDAEDSVWKRQKLMTGALAAVCLICYLLAAFGRTGGNAATYVALPCGFSACAVLFLAVSCIEVLCAPRKMTVYTCHTTHNKLIRWSVSTFIFLLCTAALSLVWLVLNDGQQFTMVMTDVGLYVLGALAAGQICRMETKTEYNEEENDTVLPFYPDTSF